MMSEKTAASEPTMWQRIRPLMGSLQGYLGLVLIIIIGIATQAERFLSLSNLTNAVAYFAPRGILAIGMTLIIITGGIDLSVGAVLAIGGTLSAWLLVEQNMPVGAILPISLLVCALFGLINGLGTALLKIQAFVMTLAMMTIARGIVREFSNNVSIGTVQYNENGILPGSKDFQVLGQPGAPLFDVPFLGSFPVLALLVTTIVAQIILSKTKLGRHIYAVGGNPTAARLSGVNVTLVLIFVYTFTGLLAGIAGPINAAYNASADPTAGLTYELDAIAAVVIGGASLAGGKGTAIGTFIGAMILTLLDNVLGLNNFSANWQLIIKGMIVVIAVVIQRPELFTEIGESLRRKDKRQNKVAVQETH